MFSLTLLTSLVGNTLKLLPLTEATNPKSWYNFFKLGPPSLHGDLTFLEAKAIVWSTANSIIEPFRGLPRGRHTNLQESVNRNQMVSRIIAINCTIQSVKHETQLQFKFTSGRNTACSTYVNLALRRRVPVGSSSCKLAS